MIFSDRDLKELAVVSYILPTYARVDLAFERGEGAWLIATNGERYLDFASGIAVNLLGHAHPRLVTALNEQAQKALARLKLSTALRRPNGWPTGCAPRPSPTRCVLHQFRRRGDGMRDQDGAQTPDRERPARSAIA